MATNAQTVATANVAADLRRRRVWGTGGLIAQGVLGLVGNIPALKDVGVFAKEGAKALEPDVFQAPRLNDAHAKKQIEGIAGVLTRVDGAAAAHPAVHAPTSSSGTQEELDAIELFRQDMKAYQAELKRALAEKYSTKLARQNDISQFLAQSDEQVSGCITDFCVDGSVRANQTALMLSESNQQIRVLSLLLEVESQKTINLENQVKSLWRLQLVQGCVLFFLTPVDWKLKHHVNCLKPTLRTLTADRPGGRWLGASRGAGFEAE